VAESNDSGGTWHGVLDGLKKGRKIDVRQADPDEKNSNHLLIKKGQYRLISGVEISSKKPLLFTIRQKELF
jgi:DNA processing protein